MTYVQVSAGDRHTVFLCSDGSAVAIGDNMFGQCDIPELQYPDENWYVQVSAGSNHTVLLTNDGKAIACGQNHDGRCTLPDGEYSQVSAGGFHTLLLGTDGWISTSSGNNFSGALDVPFYPFLPPDFANATQVSAGMCHSCMLMSNGMAYAWGTNNSGCCNIPVLGEGLTYLQVSAGCEHTVLLRSDGKVIQAGFHTFRQEDVWQEVIRPMHVRRPPEFLVQLFLDPSPDWGVECTCMSLLGGVPLGSFRCMGLPISGHLCLEAVRLCCRSQRGRPIRAFFFSQEIVGSSLFPPMC